MKVLNGFEAQGLKTLLERAFDLEPGFIENQTCGTTQEGMINFDNFDLFCPRTVWLCKLGGAGLTEGNDVILQCWNKDAEESDLFWMTYADLKHGNLDNIREWRP